MITPTDLIQEAGILVSWGLPAFPLTGKKPRCKWGPFKHRRPSDSELSRLFHQPDVDGIGVVPGPFSGGFAVRDYDDAEAYHRWAGDRPSLARAAPTVRTRRGYHVWTRSTSPAYRRCGDGEFIADGRHFTVVPPTRHPSGVLYQWVNGPPLGPSEFPEIDPYEAGFLPPNRGPKAADADIRHSALLCSSVPPVGAQLSALIREAVRRTLPRGPGRRNGQLHQFARALRDLVPDDAPPGVLYDAVAEWWRQALPAIGTKDFETTRADFRRAFAAVRVPMSQSRPVRAMRRGARGTDSRSRLLGACWALAAETGGAFFLSARSAGEAISVGKSRADVLLKNLVAAGELVVVKKGKPSRTGRTGTTWSRLAGADPGGAAPVQSDMGFQPTG